MSENWKVCSEGSAKNGSFLLLQNQVFDGQIIYHQMNEFWYITVAYFPMKL